jgi:glycosyltransferase involved in cell wall biosynthesis
MSLNLKRPISVVIIAKNEAELIGNAISSVEKWTDEVLVVDMCSTDATAEIANSRGCTVIPHEQIAHFDLARNVGIERARNEWILCLDADEEITDRLAVEISKKVSENTYDCIWLPRSNLDFPGFSICYAKFQEKHMRLFKKSSIDFKGFKGEIHTFYLPLENSKQGHIKGSFPVSTILHYSNLDVSTFIGKINSYTTTELTSPETQRLLTCSSFEFLLTACRNLLKLFLVHYLKRGNVKGGIGGVLVTSISLLYYQIYLAKVWEKRIAENFQKKHCIPADLTKLNNIARTKEVVRHVEKDL